MHIFSVESSNDMLMTIFFFIFIFISVINLIHLGLYLVGANFYDIKDFKRLHERIDILPRFPQMTVLIPAHNEELVIERCLDSVRASRVRKLEIIVIDDSSTDSTRDIVLNYIRKNPDFSREIKLLRTPANIGKAGALNLALKNGVKGEYVMSLDADSTLHEMAVPNTIEYFLNNPNAAGVAANVRIMDSTSLLGLIQKFEYMIGYRSKKFYTVTNSEFIVGGVGSTYRYSILKEVGFYDNDVQTEDIDLSLKVASLGNRKHRLIYASDVVAMTEGVQTFKALLKQRYRWKMGSLQTLTKHRSLLLNINPKYSKSLTWYRIPMSFIGEAVVLIEPFIIAYLIYISFLALSPAVFFGAYITITLYMLWNLWPDEHMSFRAKIKHTVYIPFMYGAFYIMNVVQFIAVIRCILNAPLIVGRTKANNVWVSPERQGSQQLKPALQ